MSGSPSPVRFFQYNVLSPPLALPEHFPHCRPEDLDPATRFSRLLEKLEAQTNTSSIIALEEVCLAWDGPLHAFFCQRNYHYVSSLYASEFTDFMGVALAWPLDGFRCEAVEKVPLAATKTSPWPTAPKTRVAQPTGCYAGMRSFLPCCSRGGATPAETAPVPDDFWPWTEAGGRKNRLILARLAPIAGGPAFCVAVYHMPCLFGSALNVQVMNIHASLAARKLAAFTDGRPGVLLGDFNFLPDSSPYRLLTTCVLGKSDPELPEPQGDDAWRVSPLTQRLRSAYKDKNGKEPAMTNFAQDVSQEEPFVGTLDYIFVSDHWKVTEVLPVPGREDFANPLPTAAEPSDHVGIGATLVATVGFMKHTSVPR